MSEIINKIKSFPDLASMKPLGEKDIDKAEALLDLKFAPEYREYTAEFGAVAVNGHEITGVVESKRLNVVNVTKREWEYNGLVPQSLYAIENAGIDGIIIWQDSTGAIFQSSPNSKPTQIAETLMDYIKS